MRLPGGKAEGWRRGAVRVPRRAAAAAAALGGLALAALAISPEPPAGRLLERARALGPGAALAIELGFALAVGAGFFLLAHLVLQRLLDNLSGREGAAGRRRKPKGAGAALGFFALALVFSAATPLLNLIAEALSEKPPARAEGAPGLERPPAPRRLAPSAETVPDPNRPEPASPLPPAAVALVALLGALLAGGLFLLAGRRERGTAAREGADTAAPSAEERSAGLAALRRRLESGDAARDAIIAAYDEMSLLFADRAVARGRDPARLTAREFAELVGETLLGEGGAEAAEIRALTAAFERARYSNEPCGRRERDGAVAALAALEARRAAGEAGAAR
ncbi:MAG: DUF4129 domain-containing protein [Spirochaetaceae bacterium]|nr:DUF4129 domain-containing protein [Spirochaetaceae bacterium]